MTDTELVRTIIADPVQYGTATAVGDGDNQEFAVPNAPITAGTLKVYLDGVLQALTTDYTVEEDIGLVTFVLAPANGVTITMSHRFTLLTDEQIEALLDINSTGADPIKLASADCLDSMARNQALILKKIKLLDLETDGAALARELRASAKTLRDQVFSKDYVDSSFEIAEMVYDRPSWEEKILKDVMRDS